MLSGTIAKGKYVYCNLFLLAKIKKHWLKESYSSEK